MYCNFSLTLQVKCSHPHTLLLKQISLSKWQNASRVYLCQPGSWRCLLLHLWSYEEQPLAHDVSRQQMQAIKVAAVLHPLQPLGHPQLLQKDHKSQQDEGSAVHSCPWSACCQSRGSSWRHLTGTRGIWTVVQAWEEVLAYIHVSVPFEVWSCGRLSLAMSLQLRIAPFTGSIPAVCDVCIISHVHYSCKMEGRPHSCWIRAVAFDKISQAISIIPHFIGIQLLIVVSYDPLYFCVVCCDLSIFISNFIDLIFLSLLLDESG